MIVVKLGAQQVEAATRKSVVAAASTVEEPVSTSEAQGPKKQVEIVPKKRNAEAISLGKEKKI